MPFTFLLPSIFTEISFIFSPIYARTVHFSFLFSWSHQFRPHCHRQELDSQRRRFGSGSKKKWLTRECLKWLIHVECLAIGIPQATASVVPQPLIPCTLLGHGLLRRLIQKLLKHCLILRNILICLKSGKLHLLLNLKLQKQVCVLELRFAELQTAEHSNRNFCYPLCLRLTWNFFFSSIKLVLQFCFVKNNFLALQHMSSARQRTLGGGGHHVLDYLKRMQAENPAFFYAVQGDNDHSVGNMFWVDATSRMNYSYFGDAVILDTTYRTNRYRLPFASFTGFNHHGEPVLFGCALILNESESSFIWLFRTWLQAMSGRHPVSITTDFDPFIQVAVAQVLPPTRHRFCTWGIFRETREKLAHPFQSHPAFETEFRKCVIESETIDEFESCWQSLLERYYVMDNEWLQSMYNARRHWVPVYLRDTFFGEISITEGNECLNFFFDGYVNASTTIQVLVKQYEKAVSTWHERELKADYDTINSSPVLKTPSPMEKQAASLYTRKIFMKFQEELVETLANPATKIDDSGTITTYRVAKFGEQTKSHIVTFNSFEMKASCSCQMFEYSGIICRHILAVFRAKNVLTLPSQYVLKRWTRNAKTGALLDEHASEFPSSSRESVTVRYNNLRQEAIKYVEEGAKSIQIYHVAMKALQEAAKKVSAIKSQSTGTAEGATLANGGRDELLAADEDVPICQSVEKQKKIRELTAELDITNQRCEVYRANLLAVLRDMEEQKLKLSVKVQNARLSLKEPSRCPSYGEG